jgi:hypothetical protein
MATDADWTRSRYEPRQTLHLIDAEKLFRQPGWQNQPRIRKIPV